MTAIPRAPPGRLQRPVAPFHNVDSLVDVPTRDGTVYGVQLLRESGSGVVSSSSEVYRYMPLFHYYGEYSRVGERRVNVWLRLWSRYAERVVRHEFERWSEPPPTLERLEYSRIALVMEGHELTNTDAQSTEQEMQFSIPFVTTSAADDFVRNLKNLNFTFEARIEYGGNTLVQDLSSLRMQDVRSSESFLDLTGHGRYRYAHRDPDPTSLS